jgi:hypothetical protein
MHGGELSGKVRNRLSIDAGLINSRNREIGSIDVVRVILSTRVVGSSQLASKDFLNAKKLVSRDSRGGKV